MRSLVDGADHVYVPMADAPAAFAVLAEQLELPVLWPFTSFGMFSSGGGGGGEIKLEIIESNSTAPWSVAAEPPRPPARLGAGPRDRGVGVAPVHASTRVDGHPPGEGHLGDPAQQEHLESARAVAQQHDRRRVLRLDRRRQRVRHEIGW